MPLTVTATRHSGQNCASLCSRRVAHAQDWSRNHSAVASSLGDPFIATHGSAAAAHEHGRCCTTLAPRSSRDREVYDEDGMAKVDSITTVHVVQSCHLDIGFTSGAVNVINLYFEVHIPTAIAVPGPLPVPARQRCGQYLSPRAGAMRATNRSAGGDE